MSEIRTPASEVTPRLIDPAGIEPAGIEPAGIEPAGTEPTSVVPSWPAIATPNAVLVDVSTPVRLPPLSVIAAPQLAYGVPSGFFGVGSWLSGALPSNNAANGTLRQRLLKNGTCRRGSVISRSHGVLPSEPRVE